MHHTKELVPYRLPLVCQLGGKRKVIRKLKTREGGQQGKGKNKRKDKQRE